MIVGGESEFDVDQILELNVLEKSFGGEMRKGELYTEMWSGYCSSCNKASGR